jgi:hypothetical protein
LAVEFEGQAVHDVEPSELVNEFPAHVVQDEESETLENVPGAHDVHALAPSPEYVPAIHVGHVVWLNKGLNVPARHDAQLVCVGSER